MKLYKCFVCLLEINELNNIKSHLRIIHNIKDGPNLKLKCCNNVFQCDREFLSYGTVTRHMLSCIKDTYSNSESNLLKTMNDSLSTLGPTNSVFTCNTNNSITHLSSILTESSSPSLININKQSIHVNTSAPNNNNSSTCLISTKKSPITSQNQGIQLNLSPAKFNEDSLLSDIVQLKLPESVTNKIFSSFTSYINSTSDDLLKFVLTNDLSNPREYKSLVDKIKSQKNPFSKICTTYLRNKKLESGPGYVKPIRIVFSTEFKPLLHQNSKLYLKKPKQVSFSYTPILKTLENYSCATRKSALRC